MEIIIAVSLQSGLGSVFYLHYTLLFLSNMNIALIIQLFVSHT